MTRQYFLLASASAMIFASPVAAQNNQPDVDDTKSDQTIIVTATRTQLPPSALPLTIDVIDSESFDRQIAISGSTVDAVSALLPSFSPTREKLSGAGESLRGRSPLYAINGIPQTTPVRDSSRDSYTIDSFFIDRVEVIYGSNALQGIGATGGVVNQVTVSAPDKDGISTRALIQGTTQNGFKGETLGGKVGGLVGYRSGDFDANVGATFEQRGVFLDGRGNRIGVDGTQGEIQDSISWSVFGRFGYQLSDSARIELVANHFELAGNANYVLVSGGRKANIPASSRKGVPAGDPPSNQADLLSASLTDDDLGGGTFILHTFYNKTHELFGGGTFPTFQDPAIAPLGQLFDQSANNSRKLGGKISYEREVPGFEDLVLTAGFDALFDRTKQSLAQTGRSWVPESDFRSLAPFGQANLALADGLVRLAGGLRYENVRLKVGDYTTLSSYGGNAVSGGTPSFNKLLLNGGVIIEPLDGVRAYGSYAEGYTVADVGRILRSVPKEDVDVDNYISLEPVISNNRELGVEFKRGIVDASASYFWSSSDKGSVLVEDLDGMFNVSRQAIAIKGFEANVALEIPPVPGLTLAIAYADLTGRTDTNEDGMLDSDLNGVNISPDRVNLTASYSNGPISLRLASRHYLSRTFDFLKEPRGVDPEFPATLPDFEGYTLLDAYIGYRTPFGEFALAAQNLTDEYYITYDSDTVRTDRDDRFFAGRGRTVTLSWRGMF